MGLELVTPPGEVADLMKAMIGFRASSDLAARFHGQALADGVEQLVGAFV